MKNGHVIRELSAYVDGEVRNAERIARHLQSCPDCARYHMQLRKLSTNLQALPGPEDDPHFVTRLTARLDTAETAQRGWFSKRLPQAAFALGLLVVAGLLPIAGWFPDHEATELIRQSRQWESEEAVVTELEWLLSQGADPSLVAEGETEALEEVPYDDVLEYLAVASYDEAYEQDVYDSEDVYRLLDELSSEEEVLLRGLLCDYMEEHEPGFCGKG